MAKWFISKLYEVLHTRLKISSENGTKELDQIDKKFAEQLLNNGSIKVPTETLMLPTDSLAELKALLEMNKTYCFRTSSGPFGWCATCKVSITAKYRFQHQILRKEPIKASLVSVN